MSDILCLCYKQAADLQLGEVDGVDLGQPLLDVLQAVTYAVDNGHLLCALHQRAVRCQLSHCIT